jgi:DNA polymerase elongation subunit (family B)
MVQHNLCYSTLVNDPTQLQEGKEDEEAFTTPLGAQFVKLKLRRGVIPSLLADLLGARHHAQQMIRDPSATECEKCVLDARQKAFKLAANAVYGFTGASVNSLFSRELGDSILALGREYMMHVIKLVGKDYPQLKVVYGDTDSVFVEYPGWTPRAAEAHSRQVLTPALNAQLPVRIQVKHEKVLAPFLLQHIRRYAGYENLNDNSAATGGTALHGRRLEIKGMVSG